MNKKIIIGVVVMIIIAVIGVVSSLSLVTSDDSSFDNIVENESTIIQEVIPEPENTGRNLSVELSESVGLTSP